MKMILIIFSVVVVMLSVSSRIYASAFKWPSAGYLGWTYTYPNGTDFGHNGIDIWGNTDGVWADGSSPFDGDGPSWEVYPTANGQVVYSSSTSYGGGVGIKHSDNLYTFYWHLKNITVSNGENVVDNKVLGLMNYLPGDVYRVVHVHLTVTNANGDSYQIDPSPYFDRNLDHDTNGYNVAWLESVTRDTNTTSNDIICNRYVVQVINKELFGNIDCKATDEITFLPETKILLGSTARFYVGN